MYVFLHSMDQLHQSEDHSKINKLKVKSMNELQVNSMNELQENSKTNDLKIINRLDHISAG